MTQEELMSIVNKLIEQATLYGGDDGGPYCTGEDLVNAMTDAIPALFPEGNVSISQIWYSPEIPQYVTSKKNTAKGKIRGYYLTTNEGPIFFKRKKDATEYYSERVKNTRFDPGFIELIRLRDEPNTAE